MLLYIYLCEDQFEFYTLVENMFGKWGSIGCFKAVVVQALVLELRGMDYIRLRLEYGMLLQL